MSAKHRTPKPRPFSEPSRPAGWGAWIAVAVLVAELAVCAYAMATR